MSITIHIAQETLTDKSHVYNVYFGENYDSNIMVAAVSEQDADEMVRKIAAAIEEHGATSVTIWHHREGRAFA